VIRYEFHREAERELTSSALRYEGHQPGLGGDFLDEVERAIEAVLENPSMCPLWPDIPAELDIRRKLLHRFPFGLPYLQQEDRVVFLAVAHLSRAPGYWVKRAADY
jgi:toxin ParE1/3/4